MAGAVRPRPRRRWHRRTVRGLGETCRRSDPWPPADATWCAAWASGVAGTRRSRCALALPSAMSPCHHIETGSWVRSRQGVTSGVHVCAQATILEAYEQLIDSAQHLVYIESPFFISGLQVRTFNSCFDSCATAPVPPVLHPDVRLLSLHVDCVRATASSRTASPK